MLDGSVQRYLGLAASVLGTRRAVRHLRAAVAADEREGLLPCAARFTFDLARALARRDPGEAAALAASAEAAASRLGMVRLLGPRPGGHAGRAAGPLTRREGEIAALVGRGLTNRQIAAALHISERTAENHVQHILTKLGLHTRTQIATWNTGLKAQPAEQPPASDPMPKPPEVL